MIKSHEYKSIPENMGVRFHTPSLSSVLEAVNLPARSLRLQRGGTPEQVKLQDETYLVWQSHIDSDREVAELVGEYERARQESRDFSDRLHIQSLLTEIRSRLGKALSGQILTDTKLPEAVRAETTGEPLKTIKELIGEE